MTSNASRTSINAPSFETPPSTPPSSTPATPTPAPTTIPPAAGEEQSTGRLMSILSFTQGLIPLLVAVAVIWWFGTVLKEMFRQAGTEITDATWSRYINLYSGLEALAYAAAGFLFGREVNRQRADRAEADAAKSQQVAFEAQSTAAVSVANGQALAAGVRALGDDATMHPEAAETHGVGHAPPAHFIMLRRMADTLFPPR